MFTFFNWKTLSGDGLLVRCYPLIDSATTGDCCDKCPLGGLPPTLGGNMTLCMLLAPPVCNVSVFSSHRRVELPFAAY